MLLIDWHKESLGWRIPKCFVCWHISEGEDRYPENASGSWRLVGGFRRLLSLLTKGREIHPLDPQPHRHSMLVPRWCAPRVTRCCLGKNWSRDFLKQAAGSQSCGTQVIYDSYSRRQRNLMTHAQCPLPVYYSQQKVSLQLAHGRKSDNN